MNPPHTPTHITHRITSLERWGMRVHRDFQPDGVAAIAKAGFTGVFVNGGSGIGPDQITPESMVASEVIPDLMPLTIKGNQRELERRLRLLKQAEIRPWLCMWGVPGGDASEGSIYTESNSFFNRSTKLEIEAKVDRSPDLFGYREPTKLSWRGSRPLCISHPAVQAYYRDLMPRLLATYPDLEGIFYFPGDHGPEICDDTCPRCKATGKDPWDRMVDYVNLLYSALDATRPGFKFHFTIWNFDHRNNMARLRAMLDDLHPGIGICMSITDNYTEQRKSGRMTYNQPWVNFARPGDQFKTAVDLAREQGRAVMGLAEIAQAEIWDPTCHNLPNAHKVVELLAGVNQIEGVSAIADFWGHRGPFVPHANLSAMRAWLDTPDADPETILIRAAKAHYQTDDEVLAAQGVAAWAAFDVVVDDWALNFWYQRFSFAIGRDAARGYGYRPLIPEFLRAFDQGTSMKALRNTGIDTEAFIRFQQKDSKAFVAAAGQFDRLALALERADLDTASLARREARNVELAGELIASIGRSFAAAIAFKASDTAELRQLIEDEVDARERQLEISGRIGWGGGVNPLLVSEDIQNMRLYLSRDDFPDTPDEIFHLTQTPYSI